MVFTARIPAHIRKQVQERAKGFCEYCRTPDNIATSSFHCEHIVPQKIGGTNSLDNLAWACPRCNSHKHAKTHADDPQTNLRMELFNPRQKLWNRHFMWSGDFLIIVGRTRIGRATVQTLNMNSPQQKNLRRALLSIGEHPADTV